MRAGMLRKQDMLRRFAEEPQVAFATASQKRRKSRTERGYRSQPNDCGCSDSVIRRLAERIGDLHH